MGSATYTFPDGREATIEYDTPEQLTAAVNELQGMPAPEQPANSNYEGEDDLYSKFLRGARATASAVGQTGNYIREGALKTAEGAGQLMTAAFVEPYRKGALEEFNNTVEFFDRERAEQFKKDYGKKPNPLLDIAAQVGVGAAVPTPANAAKGGAAILNSMKSGALAGAMGYNEGADTVGEKALWTAGGAVLGGLLSSIPQAANKAKDKLVNYLAGSPIDDAVTKANIAEIAFPGLKDQLTIGQKTGAYTALQTESKVGKELAQKTYIKQAQTVKDELETIARRYGPVISPDEAVARGQLVLQNTRRAMQETRKTLWDADIAAIRAAINTGSGRAAGIESVSETGVQLPGLRDAFTRIAQDFTDQGNTLSPTIRRALNELDTFDGQLSFDTLENLMQRLNGNNFTVLTGVGAEGANRAAAGQLKRALLDSMDSIPANDQVGAMFRQMSAGYRQRSIEIRRLENLGAAKILGLKELPSNPEAALTRLYNLSEGESRKFANLLQGSDTGLLRGLRRANLEDAISRASNSVAKPGTAAATFDVEQFLKATVKNDKLRAAGLYGPADAKLLKTNVEALATLRNQVNLKTYVLEPEQGWMSAASRSPAFVARTLYRLQTGNTIEQTLFDPTARAKFLDASRYVQSGQFDKAAAILDRMATATMSESD